MSNDPIVYSVVIPIYNSAPVISILYRRLVVVMESLQDCFEIVFVDDGSTDASWSVLASIARNDRRVVVMQLARNVGQGLATLIGLRQSSGEILITLDDDLQDLPEEIPKLLARLRSPAGCDVVFGVPKVRHHPSWRRFSSWLCNVIFSPVLRKPLSLRFTAFRVMRRTIALRLLDMRWPEPFLSALLFQITPRIGAVRVEHAHSALPSTRYSIRELVRMPLGYFGGLSDNGLRRFIFAAIVVGIGLAVLAYIALYFGRGGAATTFAFVAATIGTFTLIFGLVAIAAERRLAEFQRKPLAAPPIQRMICDGREIADYI